MDGLDVTWFVELLNTRFCIFNNSSYERTEEDDNMCFGGTSQIENNLSQLSRSYREDNITNEKNK